MQLKNWKTGLVATVFLIGSLPFGNAAAEGVTAGINSRTRAEYTEMGNIQKDPANGNYRAQQRTIGYLEGTADDVTAFIGFQGDLGWGDYSDASFGGSGYIGEAWVQFGKDLTLKAGRLGFNMDDGRLMGYDDWNSGNVYDGLLVGYNSDSFNLEILATRGGLVGDNDLFVVNPSTKVGDIHVSIPIMYLTNAIHSGGGHDVSSFVAGLYAKQEGDFSWRVEGYFQQNTHEVDGEDAHSTNGLFVSAGVGFKVSDMLAPWVNFDYTGAATDEDTHVFGTGLGDTHKFNGRSGIVAGAGAGGLIDVSLSNNFGELGPGSLSLDIHYMMLVDEEAAGADGVGIGTEIDIEYTVELSEQLSLVIGEALFLDQDEGASDRDVSMHDWTYVQLTVAM